jgi:hypothetical protein
VYALRAPARRRASAPQRRGHARSRHGRGNPSVRVRGPTAFACAVFASLRARARAPAATG